MSRLLRNIVLLPVFSTWKSLPLSSRLKWLAGFSLGWLMLSWLTLEFGKIRSEYSDFFCGPWGCTAPLEAVLAYHFLWILFLWPLLLTMNFGQPLRWQRTATICSLIALAGISYFGWQELFLKEVAGQSIQESYFWKRWRNQLIGSTDFPLIPCLLLAAGSWWAAGRTGLCLKQDFPPAVVANQTEIRSQ